MNDLPMGRPAGSGPVGPDPSKVANPGRPSYPVEDTAGANTLRRRVDARPVGLGSIVAFFFGLMVLFILAAAVAQFAVRGDAQAPVAPSAPPVTQDQTPARPSPPADGNPAGSTTPDAVTP
jgi:hypothetical protein